jgi:hypothetical protein
MLWKAQGPEEPIDEIRRCHPGEWLLVEVTRQEVGQTTHGRLIAHHPSREEITNLDLALSLPREMRVLVTHADPPRQNVVYCYHA